VDGDVAILGSFLSLSGCGAGEARIFRRNAGLGSWVEEQVLVPGDGEPGDLFGISVSVSGNFAFVGAPGHAALGSVYIYEYDAGLGSWTEMQQLTDPDSSIGSRVCVRGNRAIAKGTSTGTAGTALVYRFDPTLGMWTQEQELTASDGVPGDGYGVSVAVDGDVAVVGSWQADSGLIDSGAVYVYHRDPVLGSWGEVQKLTGPAVIPGAGFGGSVAVRGTVLVVGAPHDDVTTSDDGSATVFRYDPTSGTWLQEQTLLSPNGSFHGEFGTSVAVEGDVAVIGTAGRNGETAGHIFRFGGTGSWSLEHSFPSGWERSAVALSGEVIVVGAPSAPEGVACGGAAHVFRYDGVPGSWVDEQTLCASLDPGTLGDRFGSAVSLDGAVAIVGARSDDDLGADRGAAFVHIADPILGTWTEVQRLDASDGSPGDEFGASVSLRGEVLAIGAPLDDDLGADAGAVYVFRYDAGLGTWLEEQKLNASGGEAGRELGSSVAIDGDVLLAGGRQSAHVFRYEPALGVWTEEQVLIRSSSPRVSVSLSGDFAATGLGSAVLVHRYVPSLGSWVQDGFIPESNPSGSLNTFGASVSLSGSRLLVGAPLHSYAGASSGVVFAYRRGSGPGTWTKEDLLYAADPTTGARFGTSISLTGDRAVIGQVGYEIQGGDGSSSAYVFLSDFAGNWTEVGKITPSGDAPWQEFGAAVSFSGNVALVGAPGNDGACLPDDCEDCDSGAAYFFELSVCVSSGAFLRGDDNGDGVIDIADPVFALAHLFGGGPVLCFDAQDTNDDGTVDIADPVYHLQFQFASGPTPASPFPDCGSDPTEDDLWCVETPACP